MDLEDLDCPYLDDAEWIDTETDGELVGLIVHHHHKGDSYWHRTDSVTVMTRDGNTITNACQFMPGNARQLVDILLKALADAQAAQACEPAARPDPDTSAESGCVYIAAHLISPAPVPHHSLTTLFHVAHGEHDRTYVALFIDNGAGAPLLRAFLKLEQVPVLTALLEKALSSTDPEHDWRYMRLLLDPNILYCPRTDKIAVQYDRTCTRTIGVTLHPEHEDEQDGHDDATISLHLAVDEGERRFPPSVITMSLHDARKVLSGVLRKSAALANELPDLRRTITTEAGRLRTTPAVRTYGGAKLQAEVHYGHEGASEQGHELTYVNLRVRTQDDEPSWISCELELNDLHELTQSFMSAIAASERPPGRRADE